MHIKKVVLREGVLYCKQQLVSPSFWTIFTHIFSREFPNNISLDQTVFATIQFIFSTSFISQYRSFSS